LKQGAFFIEQFVLDDPLFRLTKTSFEQSMVMSQYLGMRGDSPLQPRRRRSRQAQTDYAHDRG
jgi:hypothetical protein